MSSSRVKPSLIGRAMAIVPAIWLVIILIGWAWSSAVSAASIFLKDGSVEQSDKVWQSDKYIHFILKGTRSVEIRYAKEIVDRIEFEAPGKASGEAPGKASGEAPGRITRQTPRPPTQADPDPNKIPDNAVQNSGRQKSGAPIRKVPSATQRPAEDKVVQANKGISFYDPRRPQRYWAGSQSKHVLLKDALKALALQYDRSAQWVETHMGEENDLGIIHHNLIRQKAAETDGMPMNEGPEPERGSDQAAPQAAGAVQSIDASNTSASADPDHLVGPAIDVNGIVFYDPRRPEKYWTGKMTRHHSLNDALKALSEKYHVTPEWIAEHMGDTNDLAEIHRNIQKSLRLQ